MRSLSRHSLIRASALLVFAPLPLTAQTVARDSARATTAGVPIGMMPPAGKCRVWVEGVPAARQPAPTDCATALRQKPANARVIYGPRPPAAARRPTTPATVRATPAPNTTPTPPAATKTPTERRKKPEQP